MEPITPDGAEGASEEAHAAEEPGSRSSAAGEATETATAEAAATEEIRREYERELRRELERRELERERMTRDYYAPRSAPPPASAPSDSYHHFSLLASPDTTIPPSNDGYVCPYGDETWERVHVGDEVPVCSKHGVKLIRA
ncbi:MAG: hypothetical protein LC795_11890 [Acidobacteria bacterium]|nr:hypothetical protein [Acidobacteriota bacterium]